MVSKPDEHTEYISIKYESTSSSGKTHTYLVRAKRDGAVLGAIKWYASWRQYVLFPYPNTIFNSDCMIAITEFCEDINDKHRKALDGRDG